MDKLSDNYYHRELYFKNNQVPTQSVMKTYMKPALAQVYFKSMGQPFKVLAGLEPPLKGGGSHWYMPPTDLLKSKSVLRPEEPKNLQLLGFGSMVMFGEKTLNAHVKHQKEIIIRALLDNDKEWKDIIKEDSIQTYQEQSRIEALRNTIKIQEAVDVFTDIYVKAITELEEVLMQAVVPSIQKVREGIYYRKAAEYEELLKQQSLMLQERYDDMLLKEKTRLKAEFIEELEKHRHNIGYQLHDINVEKHTAIEKLRHLLHTRNLACQVYVALKEREECKKDISKLKHQHKKAVKKFKESIDMQNFEIRLQREKEIYLQKYEDIWKTKVQLVVEKLQLFVQYCLQNLPEVADFFMNMEKLMMIQLSQVVADKCIESIFEPSTVFEAPNARPHPYYLFCDKGTENKPKVQFDETLCSVHCSSSATLFPVIIINKHCMYSACDNVAVFTDTVKSYIRGAFGNNEESEHDDVQKYDIPVTYTSSQQRQELRLESSLINVIQNEIVNLKNVDTQCRICKLPHCFHVSPRTSPTTMPPPPVSKSQSFSSGRKIDSRSRELLYERQPNWESYIEFVSPKKCVCPLMGKKYLEEHLPSYMRKTSKFEALELLDYEKCPIQTLKFLATDSKRPSLLPAAKESRTKDTGMQYDENEISCLLSCECFGSTETYEDIEMSLYKVLGNTKLRMNEEFVSISPSYLTQTSTRFATERARSLRKIIGSSNELKELFKRRRNVDNKKIRF